VALPKAAAKVYNRGSIAAVKKDSRLANNLADNAMEQENDVEQPMEEPI
jgi:hypothetical protein